MTTTLPLFWHLSSAVKKDRLDASAKLISTLEHFQTQSTLKTAVEGTSNSEDDTDGNGDVIEVDMQTDGLDNLNAQDVSYSIRRLIRGLASPRESSRLGFAVALTELLSRIDTVTCSQIVGLIIDGTKIQGSMTGQEERDVLFARLFGLTSVIESRLLFLRGSAALEVSSLGSYDITLKELLFLGEKKAWLRESAWWSITLAFDALQNSGVSWKTEAVESTLRMLFIEHKIWCPEKVAVVLNAQKFYPDKDWNKLLSPLFKNTDILSGANLQTVARILKESGSNDQTMIGTWKPQPHFVWDSIFDHLLTNLRSTSLPHGSFQEFFRVVVDESLFSSTASDGRKYWGFQIFRKALLRITPLALPMLFTRNFMRSWMNHLCHQDRYLHRSAKQVAEDVQLFVKNNPQSGFALILQLTGINGSQHFDKLTKTKIVEDVLCSMDIEGVNDYIDSLFIQANLSKGQVGSDEDIEAINVRRIWIIDQFGSLIRSGKISKDNQWVQTVLDWLAINGLFAIFKKSEKSPYRGLRSIPNPKFSEDFRAACRSRLLSCLADLHSQAAVAKLSEKSINKVAKVSHWVPKALNTIRLLEKDVKHLTILEPYNHEESFLYTRALRIAEDLDNVSGTLETAAKGVRLLISALLMLRYCDAGQDGEELNAALQACIAAAFCMFVEGCKPEKHTKSCIADKAVSNPVDVFVNTIIGLLEKSISFTRTISNEVFRCMCPHVVESTVSLIIMQLRQYDLDEAGEAGVDYTSVIESEDTENESFDSDSEGDTYSDTSNDEIEDVELRSRIKKALNMNGEANSTNTEEELMDDERMQDIDQQLVAAFHSRVAEKSIKGVKAQRGITHFKSRVLDLAETYMKSESRSSHILRFIAPLIDLVMRCSKDERQLSDKAKGILRSRIGKAKNFPVKIEVQYAESLLADLHNRAQKLSSTDLLPTISDCSVYICKALLQSNEAHIIIQTYQQSLADFLTRKNSSFNAKFFQDFISSCPTISWSLYSELLNFANKSVNNYRRFQAYQLLDGLISLSPSLNDSQTRNFLDFLKLLRKNILDIMAQVCEGSQTYTTTQLKQILKLAITGIRYTLKLNHEIVEEVWQLPSWQQLPARLGESFRFKQSHGLKNVCGQIIHHLTIGTESATTKKEAFKRKIGDESMKEKIKRKKV